eukprot:m.232105 g.232105  ORF g.232105 m.232105 type:complete len:68 (+) comp40075_c2_seq71:1596-1799(+)
MKIRGSIGGYSYRFLTSYKFTSVPGKSYENPIPSCAAAGPGAISGFYWLLLIDRKSPFEVFHPFFFS